MKRRHLLRCLLVLAATLSATGQVALSEASQRPVALDYSIMTENQPAIAYEALLTASGDVIHPEELRQDFGRAMRKLNPNLEQERKPVKGRVVKYADGTVGSQAPTPLDRQADPRLPISRPSTAAEVEADMKAIDAILGSADAKFRDHEVLGSDDRMRATPTNYYPRNAIGKLTTTENVCSGVVYGHNTVVTAAHCIFNRSTGTFKGFPDWTFQRGLDGSTQNYADCRPTAAFIIAAFANDNTPQNDMGAFKIDCSVPGGFGNGYYPLVAISSAIQTFIDTLYIVGYPVTAQGMNVENQQWEDVGRLIYDTSFLKTRNVDATGGQSGGLWAIPCQQYGFYYCQVGPHKGDVTAGAFFGMNIGHQFTPGGIQVLADFRDN